MTGQMNIFDFLENPNPPILDIEDREILKGSGFRDGKTRIYNYFKQNHNEKEKIDFLKNEYGIGGWSIPEGFCEHDPKGISIEIYKTKNEIIIPWNIVSKRITELIDAAKYLPNIVKVDVRGICDDGYCPICNICLDDLVDRCPECNVKLDWDSWKILNEEFI